MNTQKLTKPLKNKRTKQVLGIIIFCFCLIVGWSKYVSNYSQGHISNDIKRLGSQKVGLLLGTSKFLSKNNPNPFYTHRIQSAVQLYFAGKIKFILISGDNENRNYNEPIEMQKDLIARGVPKTAIYLDYAGFRTFDSVVRAKEVFGQSTFIIISQKFHCERAIYIAQHKGIEAFGYSAPNPSADIALYTHIREYFARVKMFLDLYILKTQPRYLGKKITIV